MNVKAATGLSIVLVAACTLAFGGVYPWIYIPVLIGCVAMPFAGRMPRPALSPAGVLWGMTMLAIVLQAVPLPLSILQTLSPRADNALSQLDLSYVVAPGPHALSLDPTGTLRAAAFLLALGLYFLTLRRALNGSRVDTLGAALFGLALLVAITGLIQKTIASDLIYGFWKTEQGNKPLAPFVNKNHFGGWIVMALSLVVGMIAAGFSRARRRGWSRRMAAVTDPKVHRIIAMAAGAGVMLLALCLSFSRSAILSFGVAVALFVVAATRRASRHIGWLLVGGGAALVVILYAGVDSLALRFAQADWGHLGGRVGIWRDALNAGGDFWLTGSGINSFSRLMLIYQTHDLQWHYSSAHNDYVQLLTEGGVLVALPAVALMITMAATVWRSLRAALSGLDDGRWIRVGAIAGLAAIAVQETVDFSLQIPANALLFTTLLAIATAHHGGDPVLKAPRR